MEHNFDTITFEKKSWQQLLEAKTYMDNFNFGLAIVTYSKVKAKLIEYFNQSNSISKDVVKQALIFCCELRQYCFYHCLIKDIDTFYQHSDLYVAEMQYDCNLIKKNNTFHYPYNNQLLVQLRLNIMQLLFLSNFANSDLQIMRQDFCNMYDKFASDKQFLEQALTVLGLALISAYEGDLDMTYQGLNCAARLYKPINKLVDFIRFHLPSEMNKLDDVNYFLTNPLSHSMHTQAKLVCSKFNRL